MTNFLQLGFSGLLLIVPHRITQENCMLVLDVDRGALKTQLRKRQVRNIAFRKDGKRMYGKHKYESAGMENTSTENASRMQTFSQIR